MDEIKLSTPEEIETIAAESDLIPGTIIVSFGPDKAVIRTLVKIDPVFCENPKRKAWLISHLETWLRLNGVPQYYFNIGADEADWQKAVESWGAKRISSKPEYEYKKVL